MAGALAGAPENIACFLRPKGAPDVGSDVWAGFGLQTKKVTLCVPESLDEMQPSEKN